MDLLGTGWLASCAVAPTVAALSVWLVFILHCYRCRWRNVDMFFLVIASQQIVAAFAIFAFAVVNVVRSRNESACNVVVWGLTSLRVFQLSTLTSLAFDRFMSMRWPYKYRFSVRTSQIKYHVAVLGVISALVGVAGLFARSTSAQLRERLVLDGAGSTADSTLFYCSLHPRSWDFRFNVFLVALYGLLSAGTLLCLLFTEVRRVYGPQPHRIRPNSRISSLGDLVVDPLSDQGLPKSTTGSYRSLYGFHSSLQAVNGSNQENLAKKVFCEKLRSVDLRWAAVLGTIGLCYAVNHGPSLVFLVLGIGLPRFWNPLHDGLIVWFCLLEGLLLPVTLYITDPLFKEAVKRSFRRRRSHGRGGGRSATNFHLSPDLQGSDDMSPHRSPFGDMYNEFVIIDKPYGACIKSLTPRSAQLLMKASKEDLAGCVPGSPGNDYHQHHQHHNYQTSSSSPHLAGGCFVPGIRSSGVGGGGIGSGGLLSRNNSQQASHQLRYVTSNMASIPTIYGLEKVLSQQQHQQQQPGKQQLLQQQSANSLRASPFLSHQELQLINQAAMVHGNSTGTLNNAGQFLACDKLKSAGERHNSFSRKQPTTRSTNNPYFTTVQLQDGFWGDNGAQQRLLVQHLHQQQQLQQQVSAEHVYASLDEATIEDRDSPLPQKDPSLFSMSALEDELDSIDSRLTAGDEMEEEDEEVTGNFSEAETLSLDDISFTTSANDDFEFHDTRGKDAASFEKDLYAKKPATEASADNVDTSLDFSLPCTNLSSASSLSPSSDEDSGSSSSASSSSTDSETESSLELYREQAAAFRLAPKFAVRKQLLSKLCKRSNLLEKRQFFSTTDLQQLDLNKRSHRGGNSGCGIVQTGSLTNLSQDQERKMTKKKKSKKTKNLLRSGENKWRLSRRGCFLNTHREDSTALKATVAGGGLISTKEHQPQQQPPQQNHQLQQQQNQQLLLAQQQQSANQRAANNYAAKVDQQKQQQQQKSWKDIMQTTASDCNGPNSRSAGCKVHEAFKKNSIRNSLILRQKALQKKTLKPRFKKNSKKSPSPPDELNHSNYQPLKLSVGRGPSAHPVTKLSTFGLSNIGRIGSYAKDFNREAIASSRALSNGHLNSSLGGLFVRCNEKM